MSIAAIIYLAVACVTSLFVPWIGVIFYYLFSVGQMQSMWPHHFGFESRVSLMITAATFLGLCGATAIQGVNYRTLARPHMLAILLLAAWVNLSGPFSSYLVHINPLVSQLEPEVIAEIFNKIIIFFVIAALLIDTRKKLLWLIYSFALILVYYAYWANIIYVSEQFWLFGDNGRLGGMPGSVYLDENYLAMLYVFATPVLYYIGISFSNFYIRYGIWLIIPLTWHALFLTGSRGGLLSLGVVIVYIFFRSFHRMASIGIVTGLALAIVYQSGLLLNRVDETIDNANQNQAATVISNEEALDPRLVSWGVGMKIVQDYPIFGVGVGNFTSAFPDYSNTVRHVAHNTFIQFSAECGILTGLIYLWWYWIRLKNVFKKPPPDKIFPGGLPRDYLDDMLNALLIALFMLAIFLDMMIFEIMYLIFLLSFTKYVIDHKTPEEVRTPMPSIYRDSPSSAEARAQASPQVSPRTRR